MTSSTAEANQGLISVRCVEGGKYLKHAEAQGWGPLWVQNGDQSSVYPVTCLLDNGEGYLLPVTLIRSEAVYKQQHFPKEDLPEVDYPFFLLPFLASHPSFTCLTLKPYSLLLFLC